MNIMLMKIYNTQIPMIRTCIVHRDVYLNKTHILALIIIYNYDMNNVLKTGPDRPVRPVQPSTVNIFSPVHSIRPFGYWTVHEPLKPAVRPVTRLNRTVLHEPNSSYCPLFCKLKGSNEFIYFWLKPMLGLV